MLDAARADGEVLACYVLDPRLEGSAGWRRLQFLYDSLRELRDGLEEVGDPDYPEPMVDHTEERVEALRRYQQIGTAT